MALSGEEIAGLKEKLKTGASSMDETFRSWAEKQVKDFQDKSLQGWADAGGVKEESAPVVPGQLGMKGVIGHQGAGAVPDAEAQAERVAAQLDPRFSLVPQALALSPATTDPDGDQAAQQKYAAGQKNATFVYEPPVAVVRKQLLENPALVRALRPDEPPTMEEIAGMDSGSSLYQDASNYMFRKTAEAAAGAGRTIYRYSQTPWLWSDQSVPATLKLKLGGAVPEGQDALNAFVMGVDDTGAFGAGRALAEAASPEATATGARMGINESVPQSSADMNAWNAEEHPIAYGAGQALGALHPWGVANRVWKGVQEGGGWLAQAAAKTRLGGVVADLAPSWMKTVGGIAGDAAVGGVAAGATQAGQEGVDLASESAQSGQLPTMDRLAEAGERVRDVGATGGELAAGGSALGRLAHAGAEGIRDSARFSGPAGPGAVRRTEPNVNYRFGREPTLTGETDALVKKARKTGDQAGDILAQEIQPKIEQAAAENVAVAQGRGRAQRANVYQTAEGGARQPVTHLQEMSLEKLRDHHQPMPDGTLKPVDDSYRVASKVFNRHVADVSMEPIEGALKLNPDEAATFLGPRARYKLLKDDIEAAAEREKASPPQNIERDAYLNTIKDSRARAAADEEIDAGIDDIVGDRTPTEAARAKAEQTVLREMVQEQSFVEAHGSLADYLKARGKDAVYVKPEAYDARRTDTLIKGIKDPDLVEAAKLDRQGRTLGGKKGGYSELLAKNEAEVAKAEATQKRVAPGGNAFQPLAGLYQPGPREKELVDDVRALADQSGVRNQLDRLRGLQETQAVQNRASFRGPDNQTRGLFNPQNQMDALQLRFGFPALRALEGPLGPLRGGNAGRPAVLGNGEDASRQVAQESSARGRYEVSRDKRMKELDAEKAKEKARRDKRQARRAAGGNR
jgi:hypothetical protein